jgi:hypothetical protein
VDTARLASDTTTPHLLASLSTSLPTLSILINLEYLEAAILPSWANCILA